jgi:predicted transcriptional regulator
LDARINPSPSTSWLIAISPWLQERESGIAPTAWLVKSVPASTVETTRIALVKALRTASLFSVSLSVFLLGLL